MKKSELFFTFLLIPIDIVMILLAFILAYKLRLNFEQVPAIYVQPFWEYFKFFLMLVPGWIIVFVLIGLYSVSERKTVWHEFGKIIVGVTASIALVIAWIFLTRTFFFSRLIIGFSWGMAIFTIAFGRYLIRLIQWNCYRFNIGVHKVYVLGSNGLVKSVVDEIKKNKRLGYQLIKVIDREGIEKLDTIIKNNPCDDIIVADSSISEKEISKVMEYCYQNRIGFKIMPNLLLVRSSNVDIQSLAGFPIMEFRRTPLDGWGKIIKRTFDLFFSSLFIILASPLMLIIAILIKLTSRGPILYTPERVGLEKNFIMYKFRTMHEDAPKLHAEYIKKYGNMFKLKNDPRVTTFGKILRKTSLDELPQFFNVFKGDMSLIGPRPPMPEEVVHYNSFQKKRLGVKPGITGLWQVSGRSELTFDEWVRLDSYYIENWSLWLDFQIFLKTIWVVIKGRGAY